MPDPAVPTTTHSTAGPPPPPPILDAGHPGVPDRPDLPEELLPLHEEYGAWWVISYQPLCRIAPYTARPRHTSGAHPPRNLRTDTVSLLARALAASTPDEDPQEQAEEEKTDTRHRTDAAPDIPDLTSPADRRPTARKRH
ncbi:hypothetical protein FZ103_07035 [Streptomonospora sp. PA3]|uniref:hypothetical protein n=1 Tax=Streptomonospora sp. PA3 TaxID=2607326 RepID=UPI0012DF4CF4|nr:hypothetical protein [Streptomonospora sp. PA3]MUL40942.1 hypothetical protein [Streptomonospora sp. PA3]